MTLTIFGQLLRKKSSFIFASYYGGAKNNDWNRNPCTKKYFFFAYNVIYTTFMRERQQQRVVYEIRFTRFCYYITRSLLTITQPAIHSTSKIAEEKLYKRFYFPPASM